MDRTLTEALEAARPAAAAGRVATYIPALASADPGLIGLAVAEADGSLAEAGDSRRLFTIQSVSKALALAYVLETRGEEAVFSRVGREPTGDPFNSIIRLETSERGKPFNPLINAGAIVVSSLLPGAGPTERVGGLRAFIGAMLGGEPPSVDREVFRSERETGDRNRAIGWFLRELGLLEGGVDEALDAYFMQCAIAMDAVALARAGAVLARDGCLPSGSRLFSRRVARIVKSLMLSCGLYDGSGEFCVEAGIPAKSGVGGGIMAAARGGRGIGCFGPALDARGNSAAGVAMLITLSEKLELYSL